MTKKKTTNKKPTMSKKSDSLDSMYEARRKKLQLAAWVAILGLVITTGVTFGVVALT